MFIDNGSGHLFAIYSTLQANVPKAPLQHLDRFHLRQLQLALSPCSRARPAV